MGMKMIFVLTVVSFLAACNSKIPNENSTKSQDFFTFDEKTGVLTIDLDNPKNEKIKLNQVVLLKQSENQTQNLVVENGLVSRLENIKSIRNNKEYVNTWMEFDQYGNVIYDQSYYFETFLVQKDSQVFVECFLNNSFFDDNIYVVVGDYSKDFTLNINKSVDTIYFNKNERKVIIPVPNWKEGRNNLRFVLYDDSNVDGQIQRRMSFIDKEFQIQTLNKQNH